MRLGLIGLGRIGAFHADTLASLPVIDSLVLTDAAPSVAKRVADRVGAEVADSPAALLASGVDGAVIAAATDAHPELILAGVTALVSNTRYNARGYDVRLEVHGSRDSVAVGLEDRLPLRSVEPGATFPAAEPHQFFMDRFSLAFRAELAAFTDVVAGERPSPCTIADALEAGWIAEACTTSLQQHRPVRMEEVRA